LAHSVVYTCYKLDAECSISCIYRSRSQARKVARPRVKDTGRADRRQSHD